MSIQTVNDVIARIMKAPVPRVVAIKGTWGCGKTHAWQSLIADLRGECHHQNYSYVSLFGITSINQLRIAIFAGRQGISRLDKRIDALLDTSLKWILSPGKSLRKLFAKTTRAIPDLPYGKNVALGIEIILPHLLKDTVICLDDFERSGKDLKVDELLGFISELKEQKNCQVVLIFNDEKLTDEQKTNYLNYREKVIDIELVYAPTVDEAIQIALPMDLPCRDQLALNIGKLQIGNIRILYKIVELGRLIYPVIEHSCREVLDQMAQTLVLLVWLEYGDIGSAERPNEDFYRHWNSTAWFLRRNQPESGLTEAQFYWDKLISSYGTSHLDDFDQAIYQIIRNGYVEESQIERHARQLNQELQLHGERKTYIQAWDMIHESFDDNEEEAIQRLVDVTREKIHLIGANDLDCALGFLRRFDMDATADELLEAFIVTHREDTGCFKVDSYTMVRVLTDQKLRERFQAVYDDAMADSRPTLQEALRQIDQEQAHTMRNMKAVEQASQAEFYALFKELRGPRFKNTIQLCLDYSRPPDADTQSAAVLALRQIAQESDLNAYRVECFINSEPG